jgi:hypothetical protein
MGVKVTFLREAEETATAVAQPVTLVPKAAVKEQNGSRYVFVVRQDTVERRAVQVGGLDGDRLEVRAGLRGGDRVVVSPPDDLEEGRQIVVKGS